MPRLIDPGAGDAFTLDDLVAALDASDVDVRDEDGFASLGPLLARLGRNRDFLADLVVAELKERCRDQSGMNSYGAQVFLLRPNNGRFVLRANFWPARQDPVVRASGTAPFFYDVPHDHNFPFLTYGYLGPGYWSDYYEYDANTVDVVPGELAGLRFVERARLDPGKLMLYRTGVDVHAQLPPDSFSVTLNILGYDLAQPWRDQLRFDLGSGTIAQGLTTTPSEGLLALAVEFCGGNGLDLAQDVAVTHPSPRMRFTALTALAGRELSVDGRAAVYERGLRDASGHVARRAAHAISNIEREVAPQRT
ncbi:MAG: transposase [Sphingomonas sp.]